MVSQCPKTVEQTIPGSQPHVVYRQSGSFHCSGQKGGPLSGVGVGVAAGQHLLVWAQVRESPIASRQSPMGAECHQPGRRGPEGVRATGTRGASESSGMVVGLDRWHLVFVFSFLPYLPVKPAPGSQSCTGGTTGRSQACRVRACFLVSTPLPTSWYPPLFFARRKVPLHA